jgi:thiol-disulfide isomerase/thioredoxin
VTVGEIEPSNPGIDRLRTEPEARLEYLLAHEVLREHDDGTISATADFEDARDVYVDSYKDSTDRAFQKTVAKLFDLSVEEAGDRIDDLDLSRWEVATYLTLNSYLEADLPQDVTLELAAMTAEAGGASPVPPELTELVDESYEEYLEENDRAVVMAFQQGCDPCDAMKADLPSVREDAPDGVAFAGVDGETAHEFRRAYDLSVAPTTLLFRDGDLVEEHEGYWSPEDVGAALEDAFATADH